MVCLSLAPFSIIIHMSFRSRDTFALYELIPFFIPICKSVCSITIPIHAFLPFVTRFHAVFFHDPPWPSVTLLTYTFTSILLVFLHSYLHMSLRTKFFLPAVLPGHNIAASRPLTIHCFSYTRTIATVHLFHYGCLCHHLSP